MDWQSLFLSSNGRIGRQTFWIGFAIVFVSSIVLNMVPVLGQLAALALLWPQVCIHAKRLHDMGYSGWLMLIPFGVSVLAAGFAVATGGAAMFSGTGYEALGAAMGAVLLAFAVAFLVGLGFLLWVGLTPSQPGDNRFGPPPVP
jgi:uncharacterized membrane protein YhaH (DUF805 family)